MKIVPVIDENLPELFALYDEYDRPRDMPPSGKEAEAILGRIRDQGAEIFVAMGEGMLGTYMIHICQNLTRSGRPFAVVENVICKSTARRTGIGRALMTHAVEYAKQNNCFKILLQTGAARQDNHAFYESCGFQGGKRAFQIRFD